MSEAKAVIFDLDGTLVDSNRDLVPTLNRVTAPDGLPPISREDVGHVVGQGAKAMIAKAFAFHGRTVAADRHEELLTLFLVEYEAHIADETVFFDGVLAALDTLVEQHWQVLVCTNKYQHLARKLLKALGEEERFAVITGGDTFPTKKPDAAHLIETAKLAAVDPTRCVMVGDSVNDIAAAQAASMPVIAVDFGYSDVPVASLNPDMVISTFDDLPAAVQRLTANDARFA